MRHRTDRKSTEPQITSFSKESLESADLHKPALRILTERKHPKIKL